MSKSRSFSIFLLKAGYDGSNALKDDHSLDDAVPAEALPKDASLFVLDSPPREPWWKSYFGVQKVLNQASKGALIFVPVQDRCFALSFGHVSHNLKDVCYEYDFGLRVTLNCVDSSKLKSTDILEPGVARRQRTQLPVDSDLTYFDFDRDSTILKSLTGRVKDEYVDLIKHATGSSNLRISSAVGPDDLVGLCERLLGVYESEDYKTTFPEIQNISPVRDPVIVEQLDGKLVEAFREKSEGLSLAIPDIIDYRENVWVTFSGVGQSRIYDEVFIGRYHEYLEANGHALNQVTLEDLKKHNLRLTDEDGVPRQRYSILKSLIFDTSLDGAQETYHLTEGNWYKVENDYIAKLKAYLDPLCIDLPLPHYTAQNEAEYNEAVAAADPAYVCLDRTNISPIGQTQIEPCDLYSVRDGKSVFSHIKISTLSAQLSHLFNQGTNSIELLKSENEAVEKLKILIRDRAPNGTADDFIKPIDEEEFAVIFGIVTHKDKSGMSDNLPLFSRISLMRNMKALKIRSVLSQFGFIDDQSPKTEGKKKPRKSKTTE